MADPWIFRLVDPRGDDHGAGTLVYPRRDDLAMGDLDLVEWGARRAGEDVEFEAVFARRIVSPAGRVADRSGASLESIARFGFYTFNLDIYVDQDRRAASGDTVMLPGRGAALDPAWAWEKVVCLTPRPLEARRKMRGYLLEAARAQRLAEAGRVDPSEEAGLARETEALLDARYCFPTRVRVQGRSVRFRVPETFLGGPVRPEWGYTVVVTGAEPLDRVDLGALVGRGSAGDKGLFVIPVAEVALDGSFGGGPAGDGLFPAIVDLLQPSVGIQESLLTAYDRPSRRPAGIAGVVPTGR